MMLSSAVTRLIKSSNDAVKNEELKKRPLGDGTWYIDCNGFTRLVSNNRPVLVGFYNKSGHEVITDLHTGAVYKNYTLEKIRSEYAKNVEDHKKYGGSTICLGISNNYVHAKNEVKGARYKDVETGDIYVIRKNGYGYCYYDVESEKVVRRTDYQKYWDKRIRHMPEIATPEIIGETIFEHRITVDEYNEKHENDLSWRQWDPMCDVPENSFHAGGGRYKGNNQKDKND